VRDDNVAEAQKLVRAGADVKAANRYGITPLYLAAVNGSAPMLRLLLDGGADPNATGPEGETALMTVARTGRVDAATLLIARGAKVDARETWRGQDALMWAAGQGQADMVRYLIAAGADVNAKSAFQKWERQNTLEPREKWLPQGMLTPLYFAVRQGCAACATALLDAGAEVNFVDPEGTSLLVIALINGEYEMASLLLQRGADPNLADKTGRAALYAAVDMHTMPSSSRPPPREQTPLDLIRLILDKGAKPDAELTRIIPYRTKLDRGGDTFLAAGTTPLLRAAKAGDSTVMRLLIERGANAKAVTRTGLNALMLAAGLGTKEEDTTGRRKTEAEAVQAIALALDAGLDINATNTLGQTALHGAAMQGFDQVVTFLAGRGAALDVKDKRGLTPLDTARGLAGGFGFDGRSGVSRESTSKILQDLQR
jgi:ankyrin repeat protein